MKIREESAITLIALVVTIVVLLILASVSISVILGDNGIIENAKNAANTTKRKSEQELSEIEQSEAQIAQISSYYNKNKSVNKPNLKNGMTPIYFELGSDEIYEVKTTTQDDDNWYNYNDKKWANVQTQDGSMWTWIPRFAYKMNNDNKTFDVVFLIGTTDYYYDGDELKKASRCTEDSNPDTTKEYTVHPAFSDETSVNFRNGGWDSEISGIWIAKFEAAYPTSNGNSAQNVKSSVKYTQEKVFTTPLENGLSGNGETTARNWLDGIYTVGSTNISYPTFQGTAYSFNYISIGDVFALCSVLTENGNIYGLGDDTDSHMMKNSEWGACSYLAQSQYGLNGEDVHTNNISINNGGVKNTKEEGNQFASVYAITGVEAVLDKNANFKITTVETINDKEKRKSANIKIWKDKDGGGASTTGNAYGVFDMSGGDWERTAGYIPNGNRIEWGNSLLAYTNRTDEKYKRSFEVDSKNQVAKISTKYFTVYPYDVSSDSIYEYDKSSDLNWNYNKNLKNKIYGDAVLETSEKGYGYNRNSFFEDASVFPSLADIFFRRGGHFYDLNISGAFAFSRTNGDAAYHNGFRAVLI